MSSNSNASAAAQPSDLYKYTPSLPAAAVSLGLFAVMSLIHSYQLLRTRTWVTIPFIFGIFLQWIGNIGRIIGHNQTPDWMTGPFILQALPILIAPAFFAASVYMILGRIILLVDGEKHSLIRKKWLAKIFVTGDVISFLMQGAGGGISAGSIASSQNLGRTIIVAGLGVQVGVLAVFTVVAVLFHRRMRKSLTAKELEDPSLPWKKHLNVLYVVNVLIIFRSVIRVVEYSMGENGVLLSHEVYLYVFDLLPMIAVTVIMAFWHPSEVYSLLKGGKVKAVKWFIQVYCPIQVQMEREPKTRDVENLISAH